MAPAPTTVAATPSADSLPAHREATTPPLCKFCSLSQCPPLMENHPSTQFEDGSQFFGFFLIYLFFLAYHCVAMLNSSLSALGLCKSIARLSHGGDRRG